MSNVVALPARTRAPLTKKALADHFGHTPRWVELRMREGMPVLEQTDRRGRRLYDLDAIEAWLREGKPGKPETPVDRMGALEDRVAALEALLERRAG